MQTQRPKSKTKFEKEQENQLSRAKILKNTPTCETTSMKDSPAIENQSTVESDSSSNWVTESEVTLSQPSETAEGLSADRRESVTAAVVNTGAAVVETSAGRDEADQTTDSDDVVLLCAEEGGRREGRSSSGRPGRGRAARRGPDRPDLPRLPVTQRRLSRSIENVISKAAA